MVTGALAVIQANVMVCNVIDVNKLVAACVVWSLGVILVALVLLHHSESPTRYQDAQLKTNPCIQIAIGSRFPPFAWLSEGGPTVASSKPDEAARERDA